MIYCFSDDAISLATVPSAIVAISWLSARRSQIASDRRSVNTQEQTVTAVGSRVARIFRVLAEAASVPRAL